MVGQRAGPVSPAGNKVRELEMKSEKPLAMRRGESAFCAGYLIFALVAGLRFAFAARHGAGELASTLARMTLLLGCGDAFHLVPRILNNLAGAPKSKREENRRTFWLGLGNLVSSITMTIFYVLLFDVMLQLCAASGQAMPTSTGFVKGLIVGLAVVRVALCLLPQNRWFDGGDQQWGIIRNIPFLAIGAITVIYLLLWYSEWLLACLVVVSFACYMGVVLLARKNPMMGMLMIPKTICYIWMIALFLLRV